MAAKQYVGRGEFLKALTVREQDFDVPGLGLVRFRPLTLDEAQGLRDRHTDKKGVLDTAGMMAAAVVKGMIEPALSDEDVAAIRAGRPQLIDELAKAIAIGSGMNEDFEGEAGSGS